MGIGREEQIPTPKSSVKRESESLFEYCDTVETLEKLENEIRALSQEERQSPGILLDCEGRDLGRVGGKLGLIQIGVKDAIYLVDVITLPQSLDSVKIFLKDEGLQKVVWDGRMDFSELWHGHGIRLAGVLDLQLLGVYRGQSRGIPGPRGYIGLDGLFAKFKRMDAIVHEPSVDFSRINKSRLSSFEADGVVKDDVQRAHKRDETEFWITRPLSEILLEYAAYDIVQLRALYKVYEFWIPSYPHIKEESKRYVELSMGQKPPLNAWYLEHGILPQEILHRRDSNDKLGTMRCGGCSRELHRESFRAWRNGALCHTCAEAKNRLSWK